MSEISSKSGIPLSTKFLVVDDSPLMLETAVKYLNKNGFKNIITAVDGAQAFDLLIQSHKTNSVIEYVICDWNMPTLTGIELLLKIREVSHFELTPFVMVTSENNLPHVTEAVKAGVSHYINKPYTESNFVERLNQAWKKSLTPAKKTI